ncbi:MAG: metalloregulator ArsR/SmtB family transcription factor [Alphaproteobacteria bacterium]|nr:metalloregulator ArsR/SmtB family transcription factor [Alphaproteobacteria bacterium]MBV9017511.1 metalloregulator ArsR/SmtB family transcription factor [Alphaproteobacteria bacterium]MBV9152793.1 metalloregulator ArsR/SmtB family transcription factor [Alphaproteobacteria bacterium]
MDATEGPVTEAALDRVFAALADPVRRAVLARLDGKDLLVSELAAPFDISLQAVSRHIQVLVRAGLVKQERTGRISRCRLDVGPIFEAALWLNRYSKYWQAQFDTLAAWLDHISPKGEDADALPRGQRKTGGVSPRDRSAARENAVAAKRGRARRGRKLSLRNG